MVCMLRHPAIVRALATAFRRSSFTVSRGGRLPMIVSCARRSRRQWVWRDTSLSTGNGSASILRSPLRGISGNAMPRDRSSPYVPRVKDLRGGEQARLRKESESTCFTETKRPEPLWMQLPYLVVRDCRKPLYQKHFDHCRSAVTRRATWDLPKNRAASARASLWGEQVLRREATAMSWGEVSGPGWPVDAEGRRIWR